MTLLSTDPEEERRYQALNSADANSAAGQDALIHALYDESWRVRKAAADRLRFVPEPDAIIGRLVEVLGDRGQTGARNAAAEALVLLGARSVPAMVQLLGHPDPDQRKFAADVVGAIGPRAREAEAALVAALSDEDANVRVSAAEALGQVGGREAPRALEHALSTGDSLLRLAAIEALMRLRVPPPLPQLVSLRSDPACRRPAIRALGFVRQPAAIEQIALALETERRVGLEAALGAIGLQASSDRGPLGTALEREVGAALRRDGELALRVSGFLESSDIEARRGAIFSLSLLRDPRWTRAIVEAAEDDRLVGDVVEALVRMGPATARELAGMLDCLSASARVVAAEALVELADPTLVPALERLLESPELELQLLAIKALGRSRSETAVPALTASLSLPDVAAAAGRALVSLAQSFPDAVRGALQQSLSESLNPSALRAYAQTGGPGALKLLRRAVREPDAALRAAAADAAELAGPDAPELLRLALADEATEVRAAAAGVLGRLRPRDAAVPLLRVALSDDEPAVVAVAVDAVAESGARELAPRLLELLRIAPAMAAAGCVRALSRLGLIDAAVLSAAGRHPSGEVVQEALIAGATLPEGVALATTLLTSSRWDLRAAAAKVLGASGGADELRAVEAALEDESDALVRDALMEARAQLLRR